MTNTEINIAPYHQKHFDDLIEAFDLNTPKYFDPKEKVDFENFLNQNPSYYYVAEINGKAVGCCGYNFDNDNLTGQISWVLFHPDHQGKGVGKKLVNFCLDKLGESKKLEKYVVRTSQLAFQFFAKFGFKTEFTDENYWGEGLDLYYMSLVPSSD